MTGQATLPAPPSDHRIIGLVTVAVLASLLSATAVWIAWMSVDFESAFTTAAAVTFTLLGTVILWQRPGHGIGRLAIAIGAMLTLSVILRVMAVAMAPDDSPIPPVAAGAAAVSTGLASVSLIGGMLLMVAWFPDGHRTSRLGAFVEAAVMVSVVGTLVRAVRPGVINFDWLRPSSNPFGIPALDPSVADRVAGAVSAITILAFVAAAADLTLRYRRGDPIRRAQIRWVAASASATAILVVVAAEVDDRLWLLWIGSTLLTPIAIGIAITRYHLYDIDRIISRTISYAAVTAVLFAAFMALNLALQNVIVRLTGNESPLTVAVSTLVVAVLFTPVRARVQTVIDRRFHRAHYDAERLAQGFAERLRDQIDLDTLTIELTRATSLAVEPRATKVWLRPTFGMPRGAP